MTPRSRWLALAAVLFAVLVVFPYELAVADDSAEESTVQVTGRLVDAVTGQPVANGALGDRKEEVKPDGTFTLGVKPSELAKLRLSASAPGYCATRGDILVEKNSMGDIPLMREFVIEGTVHDASGLPLSGVAIHFGEHFGRDDRSPQAQRLEAIRSKLLPEGLHFQRDLWAPKVLSDTAGRFRSQGLVPYTTYAVSALCEGYERNLKWSAESDGPGTASTVEFKMLSLSRNGRSRWTGRLLVNGAPVAGTISWQGGERRGYVKVGDDGKIDADYMPEGEVNVQTRPSLLDDVGLIGGVGDLFDQTVQFERDTDLEQDLVLEFPFGTIAGRVVDSKGRGLGSIYIGVESSNTAHGMMGFSGTSGKTKDDGRFVMEIPKGAADTFSLRAYHAGETYEVENLVLGQNDVVIRTGSTRVVRVRVLRETAARIVDGWDLYWRKRGDSSYQRAWGESGSDTFHIDGWLEFVWPEAAIEFGVTPPGVEGAIFGEVGALDGRTIELELPRTADHDITIGVGGLPLDKKGKPVVVVLVPASLRAELDRACSRYGDISFDHQFSLLTASMVTVSFPKDGGAGAPGRVKNVLPGTYIVTTTFGQWSVTPAELVVGPADSTLGPLSFEKK